MDRTRFHRVESLFQTAAELPATERDAYLRAAAVDEPEAIVEVRRLLERLDEPLAVEGVPRSTFAADDFLETGRIVGPYRIKELIGEGGFGLVYRAEQERPVRREVALKIVKPGMDSRQVLARFDGERQALARMDHPNIARVIDAGVGGRGRPYFVMDLVRGVPITTFCDEHRLDIDARLDLFLQVCGAVQHAHQKGVIHRDLKPSNVLVSETGDGPHCRIIDFGIAKALYAETDARMTAQDQLIGTPAYMSPEQAAGAADIDTRADIYALGVLLYELLTGTTPHEPADFAERSSRDIRCLLEEQEPPRPSSRIGALGERGPTVAVARRATVVPLRKAIRGDLDWIVMRAIDKVRARRYETAESLAGDVRRHQRDEPVLAGPPGLSYQLAKFGRRHRIGVTAGALTAMAIIAGGTAAAIGMMSARRAETSAQTRLVDSYLDQIRLHRQTNARGRRRASLELVDLAAEIEPSLELRNELIASLTMTDFEVTRRVPYPVAPGAYATMLGLADGDRFARSDEDGSVVVCDAADGTVLSRLRGTARIPYYVVFSPGGRYLAVKHHEHGVDLIVWDVAREQRVLEQIERTNMLGMIGFAPDESWVAVGHPAGRIERFDLPAGTPRDVIELDGRPVSIAVSPVDGRLAVGLAGDAVARILDPDGGGAPLLVPGAEPVALVTFDEQGRRLATGGASGTIAVWDASDGHSLQSLRGHQGLPRRVEFGDDDVRIASMAWDGTTRIWSLETGRELVEPFAGYRLTGLDTALHLDSGGETSTWDDQASPVFREIELAGHLGEVPVVDIAPSGRIVAVGAENGLHLCDLTEAVEFGHVLPERWVYGVRFTRDGEQLLAATDRGVIVWDYRERGGRVRLDHRRELTKTGGTSRMCLTADGRSVLVCGPRETVLVDLDDPDIRSVLASGGRWGYPPSASADGRWFFTGSWKGPTAGIWDVIRREMVREFEGAAVHGRFDPSGRYLVVSANGVYRVLDTGTWKEHLRFERSAGGTGPVAFTPDGAIAAIVLESYDVTLVDLATGTTLATLANPRKERLRAMAFSPDGATFVAAARTGAPMHVWDLRRLRQELGVRGLDWDGPRYPDPEPTSAPLELITTSTAGVAPSHRPR